MINLVHQDISKPTNSHFSLILNLHHDPVNKHSILVLTDLNWRSMVY